MKKLALVLSLLLSSLAHAEEGLQLTLSSQISSALLQAHATEKNIEVPSLQSQVLLQEHMAPIASLIDYAKSLHNTPYRRSGTDVMFGFDCSGFVSHVFQRTLGIHLPHSARDIWSEGIKVDVAELKVGDLVFYNTMRRKLSHVGIYIGNGQFIHSASRGGVRIDRMDTAYWKPRWNGARRIASINTATLTAAASQS